MPGNDRPILIVPSVLPADFARLGEDCVSLEKAGVDRIQWDVMDGHFVPNMTFGPDVVAAIRPHVTLPFEAHLMIDNPDLYAKQFVDAGCQRLIVHAESTRHLHRSVGHVLDLGAAAAVAINPATPPDAVRYVLDMVDMVLVMTVNPGFGGQGYLATMEPKITAVREMIVRGGYDIDIEVDGGVHESTAAGAVRSGANVLVAGTGLFTDSAGLEHAVTALRARGESART